MIYFSLPFTSYSISKHISVFAKFENPPVEISHSLCVYMNELKEKISSRNKEWDIYKKYTNPYEYIHSIVPHKKRALSKYRPLSRSYFKMLEMIEAFSLLSPFQNAHGPPTFNSTCSDMCDLSRSKKKPLRVETSSNSLSSSNSSLSKLLKIISPQIGSEEPPTPINTFHLAEGPGGFIEAVCNTRQNLNDKYYGMTILVDNASDGNVPAWKKTEHYLSKHPNIQIEVGSDGTGDILHIENFDYCCAKYRSSMDLITADGGFDFSSDFNKQENLVIRLLWAQVCYALCLQKLGGHFVLKIFDCFYAHTHDILLILSSFYQEVNICKLRTSRVGNSEKYVVCRGFRELPSFSIIRHSFVQMTLLPETAKIWRLLSVPIPRIFVSRIENMNAVFGQQQIENIHYTISLIDKHGKKEKHEKLIQQNIVKCVNWCVEHGVPYNESVSNIFMVNSPVSSASSTPSSRRNASSNANSFFHLSTSSADTTEPSQDITCFQKTI